MANKTYLLDTHCLIWFQENNPKTPKNVVELIQNPDNKVLFSQVSLFEIAIKQKIGKLPDFISSINDIYNQAIKTILLFCLFLIATYIVIRKCHYGPTIETLSIVR